MNFENGAEFDPGFIKHLQAFVPSVRTIYANINGFKNFNRKKMHFKMFYPKLEKLLTNYLGFYLGCMLWAVYIKTLDNKPILNNLCKGSEYIEDETLEEVNFITAFVEQFKKDVKYYLGQNFSLDSVSLNILDAYRVFLKENKGFSALNTTADLVIPEAFKKPSQKDLNIIIAKIRDVVETGKFAEFYPLAGLIL